MAFPEGESSYGGVGRGSICYIGRKQADSSKSILCVCVLTQLCSTLCDPLDCSLLSSSVHGILQARILESVAISFSKGSSQPRDRNRVSFISCIGRQILYHGATWEVKHLTPDLLADASPLP